ncbi:MAG: AmmeMemoRadiSam system protein B [Nannocystaceae bacterium]
MIPTRPPVVAGRFYPDDPEALADVTSRLVVADQPPSAAIGAVAPHASYVYSGALAGRVWARLEVPPRVVLICPNHTGLGSSRAIWTRGEWTSPGGGLAVDEPFAHRIAGLAGLRADTDAHRAEHAIEVQLPLLRARRADAAIVPICLAGLTSSECEAIGRGLAAAIQGLGERVLILASTDMSHYISADEAEERDHLALDRLRALDPVGLYEVVRRNRITMCGVIPTTVMLHAALALGAREAIDVGYTHSGTVSGDTRRVVGYAGALVR